MIERAKVTKAKKILVATEKYRMEIVLCDDCCDPMKPYQDEQVVHIKKTTARKAKIGIDRMLAIQ